MLAQEILCSLALSFPRRPGVIATPPLPCLAEIAPVARLG
jgi:hypothetical protein